jgi:hypothetical protein
VVLRIRPDELLRDHVTDPAETPQEERERSEGREGGKWRRVGWST